MDIESRLQALKVRVVANPDISVKELEQEVRELMAAGVRCRRFSDEVGLSNYTIYKIRKLAGISRPPRPHKKFREIRVIPSAIENAPAMSAGITIKLIRVKGELKVTGSSADVAALLRGIL